MKSSIDRTVNFRFVHGGVAQLFSSPTTGSKTNEFIHNDILPPSSASTSIYTQVSSEIRKFLRFANIDPSWEQFPRTGNLSPCSPTGATDVSKV